MGLTRPRAYQIFDIDYKQSVRVISITNVTLTGGAPSSVDGVNLSVGDRILVTGQSTGSQNGLYQVSVLGTGSNGTWIRSVDANQTGEIDAGMIVMVTEGEVYKDTQWKLTTNDPITIGVTDLVFEQNSAFAFGNIYANGTAVLADIVGDTVTFTPANNLIITANSTSDTVTFEVSQSPDFTGNFVVSGTVGSNLIPTANVTYNLGNTTNRWNDIWLSNSTIYLGNAQISANATSLILTTPEGAQTVFSGSIANISASTITATGNITGGNLITSGILSVAGNANVGNIGATNANLTSITATANISGGNLSTAGQIEATGNITGGNLVTAGLTSTATLNSSGNANVGNLGTIGQIEATGNIAGGNLVTAGLTSTATLNSSGNANVGNLGTAGQIEATGNITGGNITTAGNVSANYFLGNVACASGIFTTKIFNGNSEANIVSADGNLEISIGGVDDIVTVTSSGLQTTGTLTASGNITGGNIATAGVITATGNITGGNLVTTGNIVAGNLQVSGIEAVTTLNVSGDTTIVGNLTVSGTTITANVSSLVVTDPILGLGRGANGDPLTSNDGLDRGIEMFYYNTAERIAFMGFDNSEGKMISAANASIANNLVTVNSYGTTVVGTLEAEVASVTGNITGGNLLPPTDNTGVVGTTALTWNNGQFTNLTVISDLTVGTLNAATAIDLADNVILRFGNSDDWELYHNTVNNVMDLNVGDLIIRDDGTAGDPTRFTFGRTTGAFTATGNVTGGNLITAGQVVATGNITANNFIGNLSGTANVANFIYATESPDDNVTYNIPYLSPSGAANAPRSVYSDATGLTFNPSTNTLTVSVGNITTINATTITVGTLNVSTAVDLADDDILRFGTSDDWELYHTAGGDNRMDLNTGNLVIRDDGTAGDPTRFTFGRTTGAFTATGNVTGGNLTTAGLISATGNVSGGNVTTAGNVDSANVNATGTILATGNIAGGNITTAGQVVATGNITGGNIVTAGQVAATGNVTGNFFLGNGSALTGINSFGTIVVAGSDNVVADNTSDTLTLVAGDGVVITTAAGTDTITISTSGSSESIFITGGDMGTVEEPVTQEQDLGLITDVTALEIDMGLIVTAGVFYPDQLVLPSYTVAQLANLATAPAGQFVYCSNESGGSVPAFSDGTDWRRVTDRAVIT